MTVKEKLQFIQQLAGLTQTELASRLSVTFAALNRWINFKSIPRKKMLQKIDKLYLEYSGEKNKLTLGIRDALREFFLAGIFQVELVYLLEHLLSGNGFKIYPAVEGRKSHTQTACQLGLGKPR